MEQKLVQASKTNENAHAVLQEPDFEDRENLNFPASINDFLKNLGAQNLTQQQKRDKLKEIGISVGPASNGKATLLRCLLAHRKTN